MGGGYDMFSLPFTKKKESKFPSSVAIVLVFYLMYCDSVAIQGHLIHNFEVTLPDNGFA